MSTLINSFRVRLLLLLAAILVLTLSVQYYVNQRSVQANTQFIVEQQQAIMAGVALGVNSLTSGLYLYEMRDQAKQPLLGEQAERVKNILIVDEQGKVEDSWDRSLAPQLNPDKSTRYLYIKDVSLPPLMSAVKLPNDTTPLPEGMKRAAESAAGQPGAFYFPVETEKGRHFIIVVLGSANSITALLERQTRLSQLYTLAVLLITTALTAVVVWRFTQPIKSLANAARRVAGGDFSFRVPTLKRRDEMGELADLFNNMTMRLARARELETQLYNAEKAIVVSRLASAIAHEIRNPLNYINLTLDHLQATFTPDDLKKQGKFESLTKQLKSEVARINDRITEFLNYSRPPKLNPEPLDLVALARDALKMFQVRTAETNVDAQVTTRGDVPAVIADGESLHSVLTNLIINSLQAMDGNGGKITVALSGEDEGRRVRIDVSDTGRGIPADEISKVFEPYFSTKETGTGLGLAIVKKAVDDHHGTISVKSKPGEGTTFTITLPVSAPGTEALTASEPAAKATEWPRNV